MLKLQWEVNWDDTAAQAWVEGSPFCCLAWNDGDWKISDSDCWSLVGRTDVPSLAAAQQTVENRLYMLLSAWRRSLENE